MKRLEFKYLVSERQIPEIRDRILEYAKYDPYTEVRKDKEYTVRSIYYDTSNLSCYYDKVTGIRLRKKFRIRGYNNPDETEDSNPPVFLEIKRKTENFISKDRMEMDFSEVRPYLNSRLNADVDLNGQIISDRSEPFLFHYRTKFLRPVILIVYEREAFYSRFGSDMRISIDKNLRSALMPGLSGLFKTGMMKDSLRGMSILELKFNETMPVWIREIIYAFNLKRQSISKYKICLEEHNIERPLSQARLLSSFRRQVI